MTITRETVARQLTDYLQHRMSRAELVDWAEHAMSRRLNDVHLRTITESSQVSFAVLPRQTELPHIGQPDPARNVADSFEVALAKLRIYQDSPSLPR